MRNQRAAEIQSLLEGVELPASRGRLIAYLTEFDRQAAGELQQIREREYASIDEVGEELARVQPRSPAVVPKPRAESGAPPGGDDYTTIDPTSGGVRPSEPPGGPTTEQQIDAAAATVKKQTAIQQGG